MIELKKSLLAILPPLVILSLAPAGTAGNEPVQTAPTAQPKVPGRVMDRPEMASFKRITMFALKYRQKLGNMQTILAQAKRVGSISGENLKKLQEELDRLNEIEPSLARGGWNQADIDAFDKRIANYEKEFDKANKNGKVQFAAPAVTPNTVTTTTTKSTETKDTKVSKDSKPSKATSTAPAKK